MVVFEKLERMGVSSTSLSGKRGAVAGALITVAWVVALGGGCVGVRVSFSYWLP